MRATLYDELDAVIDKIEKESAYHQSPILRSITNDLRDIRDRLPDEIEEITVVINIEKPTLKNMKISIGGEPFHKIKEEKRILSVSDVLVNGKPTKCYCVVPKDQLQKYLKGRNFD